MVLERNRMFQGNLILVNRDYPLRCLMGVWEMCPVFAGQPEICMEPESAGMLKNLLSGFSQEKKSIVGVSGYRSKEEQIKIFEDSLQENGREFTEKYVAFPDHSEHQTGLAIDLAENKPDIDFICPDFPYEGVCQEFREKMADFGFIERYPKEKQKVTGIGAEPWHFRYVGTPHARLMQEMGMVLEEYVEWLKQFDFERNPLSLHRGKQEIRIGYVKADGEYTRVAYMQENNTEIEGQPESQIQVSGNNMDGFIFTCTMGKNDLSM